MTKSGRGIKDGLRKLDYSRQEKNRERQIHHPSCIPSRETPRKTEYTLACEIPVHSSKQSRILRRAAASRHEQISVCHCLELSPRYWSFIRCLVGLCEQSCIVLMHSHGIIDWRLRQVGFQKYLANCSLIRENDQFWTLGICEFVFDD